MTGRIAQLVLMFVSALVLATLWMRGVLPSLPAGLGSWLAMQAGVNNGEQLADLEFAVSFALSLLAIVVLVAVVKVVRRRASRRSRV